MGHPHSFFCETVQFYTPREGWATRPSSATLRSASEQAPPSRKERGTHIFLPAKENSPILLSPRTDHPPGGGRMLITTGASGYIRKLILRDFQVFSNVVTSRLLPTFDNFGAEALASGEAYFRLKVGDLNPLDDGQYEAASYFAEKAMDETINVADALVSMYFASIALYTLGLFHLHEQHAADFLLWLRNEDFSRAEVKFADLANWLETEGRIDVRRFANWATVDDLRLAANAIKHAEGGSASELRKRQPDLFVHPSRRGSEESAISGVKLRLRKPLFGEDLYFTPDDFGRYSSAVVGLWGELADALETKGSAQQRPIK